MKRLLLLAALPALMAVLPDTTLATPLGANLIAGGDAESGTTGWTAFTGVDLFQTADYAAPLFLYPDAPRGQRLFTGSASALAAGWQAVDISDQAAAIDSGRIGFNLAAYLGGLGDQEDNTLLYVSFLDGLGAEIGHTELGPVFVDLRDNLTVLGGFRTEGWLPGGTRSLQFSLSMDAPDGNSQGAYADNLSFTLNQAVPEPASVALVLLGLAAAATTTRRRGR